MPPTRRSNTNTPQKVRPSPTNSKLDSPTERTVLGRGRKRSAAADTSSSHSTKKSKISGETSLGQRETVVVSKEEDSEGLEAEDLSVEDPVRTVSGKGQKGQRLKKAVKKVRASVPKTIVKGKGRKKVEDEDTEGGISALESGSDLVESEVDETQRREKREKQPRRKRKTKEEKEAEAMPLALRTTGLRMFVGAHVSAAKGVHNSVTNSVHIGGNAFALFLKSQRKWDNPALQDEHRDQFRAWCLEHKYDAAKHILPHGSYLVNLGQEDSEKAEQAYTSFVDDLKRCEALGIVLYNFHPGASGTSEPSSAITRVAKALNRALDATSTVVPVLENMAGSGTVIGGTFQSLGSVISQIKPQHKHRIGVCIDTCHSFAAGYDLRTPESFSAVLNDFDKNVGLKYLKALHINDSKAPLGSHRDLHANIGTGFLGLRAFHNVMNERRFENLPLILETPIDKADPADPQGKKMIEDKSVWAREIKLLESLIGMDVQGDEFQRLERELSEKGRPERQKLQAQFEKKLVAERKKAGKMGKVGIKEKGQGALAWGKQNVTKANKEVENE